MTLARMVDFRLVFLFLCSCISVSHCNGQYEGATSCEKLECPEYKVVHSENHAFEIRSYKDSAWISSPNITSYTYEYAAQKGFTIAYSYFLGNNSQGAKLNMTAPVLVDIQNYQYYIVHLYVPRGCQNNPPSSLSNEVRLAKLPPRKFAVVRRFNGVMNNPVIATQLEALKKSLAGTRYQSVAEAAADHLTVAAYYRPLDETKKPVNEIMLWFD
ncbi:uncharacterized protein LOC142504885 [Primulina tabacum]|uniref:uncharacterized protein LOC142504885 n=1 Tax=Primulina tabacum TaxID=48773 RepID=UPI003F591AB3